MASLSYQLTQSKQAEEKLKSEKANLQLTIQNLEIRTKKMSDNEKAMQREINTLLERIASLETMKVSHSSLN